MALGTPLHGPTALARADREDRARGQVVLLWMILALAAGLRFWRLGWGLDAGHFPDEEFVSWRAAVFGPASFVSTRSLDPTYGPLTGYLAGIATRIAHAAGWIAGPLVGSSPSVLLITRGVSAAAGVATVWITYALTRRASNPRTALVAAAFMAVTPFDAMYAHVASTDVLLATCFILTALASFVLATRGSLAAAFAAGAAAALAVSTKYTGAAALCPVAWAILEQAWRSSSRSQSMKLAGVALAGFVVVLVALCLPYLLTIDQVLLAMRSERSFTSVLAADSENYHLTPSLGWYGRPYLHQLVASLPYAMGWPLYALALVGVGVALWRRDLGDRIVFATVVPYFVVMGGSQVIYPRYLLPMLPGLAVLAARAVPARPRPRLVVVSAVLAYSLVLSVTQIARMSWDQQREVASWVARFASSRDARIGAAAEPKPYFNLEKPMKRAGVRYDELTPGRWLDGAHDVLIVPEWREIAIRRDTPGSPSAAELDRLQSGEAGYREAVRWRSWYLQRDFYAWLDPAFAGDLWQGETGFAIYVRSSDGED